MDETDQRQQDVPRAGKFVFGMVLPLLSDNVGARAAMHVQVTSIQLYSSTSPATATRIHYIQATHATTRHATQSPLLSQQRNPG